MNYYIVVKLNDKTLKFEPYKGGYINSDMRLYAESEHFEIDFNETKAFRPNAKNEEEWIRMLEINYMYKDRL
jgi:hypothetical protein